ncbi:hypothetical protein [Thalassobaculum litoreum]|uniref:Uncharacterized protein n=1 Tax=Thalassobaculum litoreum DSM 18839 TaxID=1123362 RepID=A0A8G2EWI6_9PROT|nr:hypothetical protein [Thalassobaculum litoreum]SDF83719.1 hypothetical protein SAMN05660686_02479 [Thalassobaculum litoreum DSM 18839]
MRRPRAITPNGKVFPLEIPVSELIAYAHGIGIVAPDAIDEFITVADAMDRAYLEYSRALLR